MSSRSFHLDEAEGQRYSNAWDEIFTKLGQLQASGVKASDPQTRPLALQAKALIAEFTAGDKGIEQGLEKMYQQEGGGQMLRNHGLDVSDAHEAVLHAHVTAEK